MNVMQLQQALCRSPKEPRSQDVQSGGKEPGLCTPHHIKQPDGCTLEAFATLGEAAPSLEGDSWEGTQMGAASRERLD